MSSSDIYADLNSEDLGEKIIQLEELLKVKELRIQKYEDDVQKLCFELTRMKRTECALKTNISELFNSSKLEIKRKDLRIAELQTIIDNLIVKQRYRDHNDTSKQLTGETHQDQSFKHVETDRYSTTQRCTNSKSHSRSPKHLSCNMQQVQLKLENDFKQEHKSKSRSKSPKRQIYSLQATVKNDPITPKHRSRSKSPRYLDVQQPYLSLKKEDSFKIHQQNASRSRSKSPRHRSRSRHRLRSIVDDDFITQQNQRSRSRSKSPRRLNIQEPHLRSISVGSSKVSLHKSSKNRSKSPRYNSNSRERHLSRCLEENSKTRSKSPKRRNKQELLPRNKNDLKFHSKGTRSLLKSPRRHSFNRRSGIKSVPKRRHRGSTMAIKSPRRTDHDRSRYSVNRSRKVYRSFDYRIPQRSVTKKKNSFHLKNKCLQITINNVTNSNENFTDKGKDRLIDYANDGPLKHNSKSLKEEIKTNSPSCVSIQGRSHMKQNSSENRKENPSANSERIENSKKVLLNNNKMESVILDKTIVNQKHNSEFIDNEQVKVTTDIKLPISTCELLPTNRLSSNLTALNNVDKELEKTGITVRRRQRCVIQLI